MKGQLESFRIHILAYLHNLSKSNKKYKNDVQDKKLHQIKVQDLIRYEKTQNISCFSFMFVSAKIH